MFSSSVRAAIATLLELPEDACAWTPGGPDPALLPQLDWAPIDGMRTIGAGCGGALMVSLRIRLEGGIPPPLLGGSGSRGGSREEKDSRAGGSRDAGVRLAPGGVGAE